MGTSATAYICYGVTIDKRSLPWHEKDNDIEEWWRNDICKYVPPFKLYDKNSKNGYVNGIKPDQKTIDLYYKVSRDFDELHPIPIEIVCYGSLYDNDSTEYIICVNDTKIYADWSEVTEVPQLTVDEEKVKLFKEFCKTYLNIDVEPKWLLSACYG